MKLEVLQQIISARENKQPIALLTRLADGAQSIYNGTTCHGAVALSSEQLTEARGLLVSGRCAALKSSQGGIFIRSYAPPARLVIVGAVHIAQYLAPMAALAGFEVIVVDPRQAFATGKRFPGVTLVTDWPQQALAQIGLDDHTAVVTLTHDSKLDDPALVAALQSRVFYVGALGSRRTHAKRVERLSAQGLAEQVPRIHAPVGLNLGGRAAAEIAVSILAQVIQELYRP